MRRSVERGRSIGRIVAVALLAAIVATVSLCGGPPPEADVPPTPTATLQVIVLTETPLPVLTMSPVQPTRTPKPPIVLDPVLLTPTRTPVPPRPTDEPTATPTAPAATPTAFVQRG